MSNFSFFDIFEDFDANANAKIAKTNVAIESEIADTEEVESEVTETEVNEEVESEVTEEVEVEANQINQTVNLFGDIEVASKKSTKATEKKQSKSKSEKKEVKKGDKNTEIENKCKEYSQVIVKFFTREFFTIEDENEIKEIKLANIKQRLIIEHNLVELNDIEVVWHITGSEDKSVGYLIPTYNFMAKG